MRRLIRAPRVRARRLEGARALLGPLLVGALAGCAPEEPPRTAARDEPRARPATATGPPDAAALAALGYAAWDAPAAPPPRGARVHDAARVAPGWNVFADDVDLVRAVDAQGRVRRAWRVPGRRQVETARVLEGGRLLALSVDEGLTLLEPDGALVWSLDLACHHDVAVRPGDPPGARTFAVATHTEREHAGRRVRFDEVRFVSEAAGALLEGGRHAPLDSHALRAAWLAPFAAAGRAHVLDAPPATPSATVYDYFHLNSVQWERAEGGEESLLLCLRNVDTVLAVRLGTGEVRWHAGPGVLDWPHMPRRLPPGDGAATGDVLVFDNGRHRGWSRAVALGADGAPTWSWQATPREGFFSPVRGAAQRLPNGNTLLTESERGHVLEVAPDGAVVWEYWNPDRRGAEVRRIYRMERYPLAAFE